MEKFQQPTTKAQHPLGGFLRAVKDWLALKNLARLPLTLTLSPGEREQPLDKFLKFDGRRAESSRGFAKALETFLPLPAGVGRGEGERGVHFKRHAKSPKNNHLTMRFFKLARVLLLAPTFLHAQLPPQLPPGVAVQLMVPQPAVDVSPAENVSATAAFDPPTVRAGEKTFYRVTVDATQNSIEWSDEISAPTELKFGASVRGQVSRVEGNRFHPLTSFVHEVTATAAGHFTVPAFMVPSGWQPVEIPAATLDVAENNSAPAPGARKLRLEVSETNLFFGQPFHLRVLLPVEPGGQIEALREIQINSAGLMTDKISTRQSVETVNLDGQMKPAFVYTTVATPMAAGALAVSAQAFTAGRDFGGQIVISGQVTIGGGPPKYVLLVSDALKLNVQPLPTDGELPGFTGALGKFAADQPVLATNRLRVGEPVHLRFAFLPLTNLTRFVPPALPRARDWQIIADNPPGNGVTLIPLTDEATNTPAIPFSAFDPATKKFYDLTIAAQPVTVSGEGLPVQLSAWNSAEKISAPLKLSGLAAMPGKTVASLKPQQLQGWYVFLALLPLYVIFRIWQRDERRRFLEAHPEIVRRMKARKDLRVEKIKLREAVAAGDAEKFVRHAAAALRIVVAPHFPADDRALVGGDVLAQLDETERGGVAGETVRKIFAAADAQFAGTKKETADLLGINSAVQAVLEKLEAKL